MRQMTPLTEAVVVRRSTGSVTSTRSAHPGHGSASASTSSSVVTSSSSLSRRRVPGVIYGVATGANAGDRL